MICAVIVVLHPGLISCAQTTSEDCERTNKMVSMLAERSPNISDDLLSSRVGLKFYMSESCAGAGKQGKRWSIFKPVAESLKNLCLSGWDTKDEIMNLPNRFAPPTAPPNAPPLEFVKQEYAKLTATSSVSTESKWAVCVNMTLNHNLASCSVSGCLATVLCFGQKQEKCGKNLFTPYLVVEKVRTTLHLLPCVLTGNQRQFTVMVPLQFTTSHAILASFFKEVMQGHEILVSALGVSHFGRINDKCPNLLEGAVGPIQKLQILTKPSRKVLAKLSKVEKTRGGKYQDGPEQEQGQDEDFEEGGDVAEEGLNLLLEEAEQEVAEELDGGGSRGEGGGDDDDALLVEQFCRHELEMIGGVRRDDSAHDEDLEFAEEMADETGEAQVNSYERTKIEAAKQKASFVNAEKVFEAVDPSVDLTFDERLEEAILNDEATGGNFEHIPIPEAQAGSGSGNNDLLQIRFLDSSLFTFDL